MKLRVIVAALATLFAGAPVGAPVAADVPRPAVPANPPRTSRARGGSPFLLPLQSGIEACEADLLRRAIGGQWSCAIASSSAH